MYRPKQCEKCGISWEGEDIYQYFYKDYRAKGIPYYATREKALETLRTHKSYIDGKWRTHSTLYLDLEVKTDIELAALASACQYGWSIKTPKTFGQNCHFVEVPAIYDGALYGECDSCGFRWKVNPRCPDKYIEERNGNL